jgi:endonuclease YncB( thermonuclease family)
MPRTLILVFFLTILTTPARAVDFQGEVVGVIDGDTIKVMREGQAVIVDLAGIDCPEKKQPFGKEAEQFTSRLASSKVVTVKTKTTKKYGGIVADVILPDSLNLNHELLQAGLAWWNIKEAPDDWILADMEARARTAKTGLWTEKRPIPPWEWRKINQQNRAQPEPVTEPTVYKGDASTNLFHKPGCRYYGSKLCVAEFDSREEAIEGGFKPCEVCKP